MTDTLTMTQQKLLLVDDDENLRVQLSRAFSKRGLAVHAAASAAEASEVLENVSPDLAVVDLRMPGESGLSVLEMLRDRSPRTRSVVLTGYGSIANAVEAMRLGAVNYVTKPADADEVLHAFDESRAQASQADQDFERLSLAESEWNHIQRVLADCGGNITHAARILDIPRRTLQRKLKKMAP